MVQVQGMVLGCGLHKAEFLWFQYREWFWVADYVRLNSRGSSKGNGSGLRVT